MGRWREEISVYLQKQHTLSPFFYSPAAALYFNKPWMREGYSPHTGSKEPYRSTTLPLTALYERQTALCKLHWPLFLTPDVPPLLTSFLPLLSALSFRTALFVLMSCSWKRKSHPSDHPHAQTPAGSPWRPSPASRERQEWTAVAGRSTMQMNEGCTRVDREEREDVKKWTFGVTDGRVDVTSYIEC